MKNGQKKKRKKKVKKKKVNRDYHDPNWNLFYRGDDRTGGGTPC